VEILVLSMLAAILLSSYKLVLISEPNGWYRVDKKKSAGKKYSGVGDGYVLSLSAGSFKPDAQSPIKQGKHAYLCNRKIVQERVLNILTNK